jgi:hypothetical protein
MARVKSDQIGEAVLCTPGGSPMLPRDLTVTCSDLGSDGEVAA